MTRHQSGYVYKKNGQWCVRYYDFKVENDGSIKRVQKFKQIVAVGGKYRTKNSVLPLIEEFLRPLNDDKVRPESTMNLVQFVERDYLPWVLAEKNPSTYKGYKDVWNCHLRSRFMGFCVRDFEAYHANAILLEVAQQKSLAHTTLKNIKGVMSGIFKCAISKGFRVGANPIREVSVPRGQPSTDTHAYLLHEIRNVLAVLDGVAATVVVAAAYGGFSKSELRGLLWEEYDGRFITVVQGVWNSYVRGPKNHFRKASVPVIGPLRDALHRHWELSGKPRSGFIFANSDGGPLNLDNLANRVIKPTLNANGLEWHGWHAFRRGLATNLNQLGVKDKAIQQILRHGELSTTMNIYVKGVRDDAVAAMKRLESVVCTNMHSQLAKLPVSGGVN